MSALLRSLAWIGLLAFGLLVPGPAAASDHARFYKEGLDAAAAGDWQQVDRLMRRAIAERPEEKRRRALVRSGYFPHYYLGLARFHLGDCPGALASWAESESQGAIVGRKPYEDLRRLQADCQQHGAPSAGGQAAAAEAVPGRKSGKEKARSGQRLVDRGADPARKTLGALARISPDSDLGAAARKGQKAVDALETAADLVDLALPPSAKLEAAIDAYFAGKPGRTLEWLQDIDMSDPRARAQVYLFRAAASFRLHLLNGRDEAHLGTARENADLFQQESWRKDLPEELFDPRFVRFLRGGG